jgi:lipid-A-disaccharide synthase
MRRDLRGVLCIFPFEEPFYRSHGVPAHYIGHPLTRIVRPSQSKHEFFRKHGIDGSRPLITMLPGSRVGEVARHLPAFTAAGEQLSRRATLVLATPAGFSQRAGARFFTERTGGVPIKVIEGETRDAIAHADVALAASGTVTVETALLGTPMVTCYRVHPLSWTFGRRLVRVPFFTMVNLVAGRRIVPEVMQGEMTGVRLAAEVERLLTDFDERARMKRDLAEVAARLATAEDPIERAAEIVAEAVDTNRYEKK